jgi:DNA-binding beta-propeller fold protein YncE
VAVINRRRNVTWFSLILLFISSFQVFPQRVSQEAIEAAEEYRWGIQAYNKGRFNDAILAFEKSLNLDTQNGLTLTWLGNAYFRSGFEEQALLMWRQAQTLTGNDIFLENWINLVSRRRGLGPELDRPERWVASFEISGPDANIFLRASSVRALQDGGYLISDYLGNEVIRLSVNGTVVYREQGGIQGFDHPFDALLRDNNTLVVSEYRRDTIAIVRENSLEVKRFGSTGRGEGQLLGPSFLALDSQGYIYVSEIGNRRVSKFTPDGDFVLSFGKKEQSSFSGFRQPSGIVVYDDEVFVADSMGQFIAVFDTSGNYIRTIAYKTLHKPEGLRLYSPGKLLVADSDRIVVVDMYTEQISLLSNVSGHAKQITSADVDWNGNISAVDFNSSTFYILSDLAEIYSGLGIVVEAVDSDKWPEVYVTFRVETPLGEPIVGLRAENFIVKEDFKVAANSELILQASNLDTARVAVVVPADIKPADLETGLNALYSGLDTDAIDVRYDLIFASDTPFVVIEETSSRGELINSAMNALGSQSSQIRFDRALRLGGDLLLREEGYRVVVWMESQDLNDLSFPDYNPVVLSQYLRNNDIQFLSLQFPESNPNSSLEYLAESSGGMQISLFRPQGLVGLDREILNRKNSRYIVSYTSFLDPDFGNRFIEMQIEAFYLGRSSQGRGGYFAPMGSTVPGRN